jgi:hypothetical protein
MKLEIDSLKVRRVFVFFSSLNSNLDLFFKNEIENQRKLYENRCRQIINEKKQLDKNSKQFLEEKQILEEENKQLQTILQMIKGFEDLYLLVFFFYDKIFRFSGKCR